MDSESPTALLWIHQLKREHKYLLQRVESLESKNKASNLDVAKSHYENSVSSFKETFNRQQEGQDRLAGELRQLQDQMLEFGKEFSQNFNSYCQANVQNSQLAKLVTEIDRKVRLLDAEIEDDAFMLTTAVTSVSEARDATNGLVEKIGSLGSALVNIHRETRAMVATQEAIRYELQQTMLSIQDLVRQEEETQRRCTALEKIIADLGEPHVCPKATSQSSVPALQAKAQTTHEHTETKSTSQPALTTEARDISSLNDINRELSGSGLQTSVEGHSSREPDQDEQRLGLPTQGIYPVNRAAQDQNTASKLLQVRRRTESVQASDALDRGALSAERGSKQPSLVFQQPLTIDEKFVLPVTLPGHQTRSKTRAAILLDNGFKEQGRNPAGSSLNESHAAPVEGNPAKAKTITQVDQDVNSNQNLPKRTQSDAFAPIESNIAVNSGKKEKLLKSTSSKPRGIAKPASVSNETALKQKRARNKF